MSATRTGRLRRILWHLFLFVPFFAAICVPLYNRVEPQLFGIPFFYWFQFVWIVVAAIVTALAYFAKI